MKSHGLSSTVSLSLSLAIMFIVAASAITIITPNLMYCSDGEVSVQLKYCSQGIYSREFGEFNISAGSWTTIMVKFVEAPNNIADTALKYLRQKGFDVSTDDVYGFTMIMRPVGYKLIRTGITTTIRLPNATTIAAEAANVIRNILNNETLVIVGRNLTDTESPIYVVKIINGRPAAAAKLLPVLVNETRSEYFEDFSEEMASKLNTSIDKLIEYKVPMQMRRVVVVKEYRFKVVSGDPDALTIGSTTVSIGPILYEKHSQITLSGIVFAEAVAKAQTWFLFSSYYTGAILVIDQSYCSLYPH